jgi:hypothetical protein
MHARAARKQLIAEAVERQMPPIPHVMPRVVPGVMPPVLAVGMGFAGFGTPDDHQAGCRGDEEGEDLDHIGLS